MGLHTRLPGPFSYSFRSPPPHVEGPRRPNTPEDDADLWGSYAVLAGLVLGFLVMTLSTWWLGLLVLLAGSVVSGVLKRAALARRE
jgi:hypothetical protein